MKPKCELAENPNYIRPKLCPPVPQAMTELAVHTANIQDALQKYFKSQPKKIIEMTPSGIPFPPNLPYILPPLPNLLTFHLRKATIIVKQVPIESRPWEQFKHLQENDENDEDDVPRKI